MYTDGSKKEEEAAIAWVLLEGQELVEEEKVLRVPGKWNITKIAICSIAVALKDMKTWGREKIRIFSDSMSGIKMIRDMKSQGESAPLWEKMVEVLNEWETVTIEWIPGHREIDGNKMADRVSKAMRNRRLNVGGRWTMMDYGESSKTAVKMWKEEEWQKWHEEEGDEYYERKPKKPKHLKGMTRLDGYVLMRLRLGADKRGHEECKTGEFRHHLAMCERFNKDRPELHTLYDDKVIDKWKKWWTINEYLGMGVPTNTTSHDGVCIMYGNPFEVL